MTRFTRVRDCPATADLVGYWWARSFRRAPLAEPVVELGPPPGHGRSSASLILAVQLK